VLGTEDNAVGGCRHAPRNFSISWPSCPMFRTGVITASSALGACNRGSDLQSLCSKGIRKAGTSLITPYRISVGYLSSSPCLLFYRWLLPPFCACQRQVLLLTSLSKPSLSTLFSTKALISLLYISSNWAMLPTKILLAVMLQDLLRIFSVMAV
jgi:hypothetical protein